MQTNLDMTCNRQKHEGGTFSVTGAFTPLSMPLCIRHGLLDAVLVASLLRPRKHSGLVRHPHRLTRRCFDRGDRYPLDDLHRPSIFLPLEPWLGRTCGLTSDGAKCIWHNAVHMQTNTTHNHMHDARTQRIPSTPAIAVTESVNL